MKRKRNTRTLTIASLLVAIGILIPMISPIKILMGPASFTLASHVATFIAMFISPFVAVTVAFGTAVGFLLGGFPIVISLRAASHLIFSYVGAKYLEKNTTLLQTKNKVWVFSLAIGILHAVCEMIVVTFFYFSGNLTAEYYDRGLLVTVMGLIGVGTVIHSMVDFWLAQMVWKALPQK